MRYAQGHQAWAHRGPKWLEDENGCWIWQRAMNDRGYGIGTFHRRPMIAHRGVYIDLVGPIPTGLVLDHKCGVTACVNPAHMDPVSQQENVHRQSRTKMTEADVADAYRQRMDGASWYAIAAQYGVAHTRVLTRVKAYAARKGLPKPPSRPGRPSHALH